MSHKPIQVGPDMRIIHPDFGDISEDVAQELAKLRIQRNEEAVRFAARDQLRIAATCNRESIIGKHGLRLEAQIDENVFNYWEAREGREFWKHEMKYMLKRHPEMAVKSVSPNATIVNPGLPAAAPVATTLPAPRTGVRGKRGRWAA